MRQAQQVAQRKPPVIDAECPKRKHSSRLGQWSPREQQLAAGWAALLPTLHFSIKREKKPSMVVPPSKIVYLSYEIGTYRYCLNRSIVPTKESLPSCIADYVGAAVIAIL